MSERIEARVANAFAYQGENAQMWVVHKLLDAAIESENAEIYEKSNKGEDRAFHAGGASALLVFKQSLLAIRETVLEQHGITSEKQQSSESDTI